MIAFILVKIRQTITTARICAGSLLELTLSLQSVPMIQRAFRSMKQAIINYLIRILLRKVAL